MPVAEAGSQRPKRPFLTWLRRFAFLVFVVVAALVALFTGWLHSDDFQRRATSLAETLIEDQTGEQVTLSRVVVKFWPPGVDVDGFHVFHAPTGETIASAERIRVPLVLRDGGIKVGKLGIQRPVVQVHLDEEEQPDGKKKLVLREFRNWKKAANPRPLEKLPFNSLALTDGSVRLIHPKGKVTLSHLHSLPLDGPIVDIDADLHVVYEELDERTHLHFPRVQLGPDVITVPDIELKLRSLALEGDFHMPLNGDIDADLTASADLDDFNDLLAPPRQLHGLADLDVHIGGKGPDIQVEAAAYARSYSMDLPGKLTPVLHYNIGDVTASVIYRRDGVKIERALIDWGEHGSITAWGAISLPDLQLTNSYVHADALSLEYALKSMGAAPNPWIDMKSDIEIAWEGPLDPMHLEGDFDLSVHTLEVGDRPWADPYKKLLLDIPHAFARGRILLEKDHIVLDASQLEGPRTKAELYVDIGFGPRGPLDMRANIWGADLADFQPLGGAELQGRGVVQGRIWGPFNKLQFRGSGDVRGFSAVGIPWADRLEVRDWRSPRLKTIEFYDAHATKGNSHYQGTFKLGFQGGMHMDTALTLTNGRVEDMVGMFIDLPGMTGDMNGYLTMKGPFNDMDGEANFRFADVDLWGERFSGGYANGYMDTGLFTLDDLRLTRGDGNQGLIARGTVKRDWALDMELLGDGFTLQTMDRIPDDLPVTGDVSVYSKVGNTVFDPSPDGRITVTNVFYEGHPIDDSYVWFDSTDGVMDYAGVLKGGEVTVDGTLGLWGEQPYAMKAQFEDFTAHAFYPEAADGRPVRAVLSGHSDISGDLGEVWSPVDLSVDLDTVEVAWRDTVLTNPPGQPWHYAQNGNAFEAFNIALVGGDTDFRLVEAKGDNRDLDVKGEGKVDLNLLQAMVPGMTKSEGEALIEVTAVGTAPNVHTVIDVEMNSNLMRYETIPVAFEDMTLRLRAQRDRVDLLHLQGQLGGGTITLEDSDVRDLDSEVRKSFIAMKDWYPDRYDIHTVIHDAQVQWVDYLPPAIGNANLSFDGPADALLLHGDIEVTDLTWSERIDWEDWVVEYREELVEETDLSYEDPWFSMDVGISAPNTIKLRNNVAEAIVGADLRIIGDTSRPGLTGEVDVKEGFAFIQDRNFRLQRGRLDFSDPWTWDPELDFDMLTTIESRNQTYRVNYLVRGPFSNWTTETRSEPRLASADVNALLWFGATTEELAEMGQLGTAVGSAFLDLVATDFVLTQASEFSQDAGALVDRFDVVTGVNARGEYSSEPRVLFAKRFESPFEGLRDFEVTGEVNLVRGARDTYVRLDQPLSEVSTLSAWYATLQRDRVLPIGGAYGVDVSAEFEWDPR